MSMGRFFQIIVMVLSSGILFSGLSGAEAAERKTGVLIFPFSVRGVDLTANDLEELKSYLGTRLTIEKVYYPMPENVIQRDLGIAKLQSYRECYDEYCRVELGRAVFADKSLSVEITEAGGFCSITAKMYDLAQEMPESAGDWSTSCSKADIRSGIAVIAAQLSGKGDFSASKPGRVESYTGSTGASRSVTSNREGSSRPVEMVDTVTDSRLSKWSGSRSPAEPPEKNVKKEPDPSRNEYFAMRLQGGGYGGIGEFTVVTLRWKHFLVDILRFGAGGVGPGIGSGLGWLAYGGTAFGVPFHLDKAFRHEIRLQTGLLGGIMVQMDAGDQAFGPFVLLETSWVFHYAWNRAFQMGLEFIIPTMKGVGSIPDPAISGFVGIRF